MLKSLLSKNRDAIIKKWFALVLETYPADARKFFAKDVDSFSNPVGSAIFKGMGSFYDELLSDGNDGGAPALPLFFEDLIKVRAVQELRPSRALAFVPGLKTAIWETIGEAVHKNDLHEDYFDLLNQLDRFALAAFDKYMESRERTYSIKANEIRRRSSILLKRMTGVDPESDFVCPSKLELVPDREPGDNQ